MRSLEFDEAAFEDLAWWIKQARSKLATNYRPSDRGITDRGFDKGCAADPFKGIGKPEPLKHELKGCWSRRIDQEHRLIYQVTEEKIRILACRYHY